MGTMMHFFEKLKINTKLVFGLGFMMLIVLALGLQSVYSNRLQGDEVQRMYEVHLKGVSDLKEASIHLMETGRSLRQMILAPDEASRVAARLALDDARARMNAAMVSSEKEFNRPEGARLLSEVQEMLAQYQRNVDHAIVLLAKDRNFRGDEVSRFLVHPENTRVFEATDLLMSSLVRRKEAVAQQAALDAKAFSSDIETWSAVLLVLGLGAGLGAGLLLGASVRRPSERLRQSIESLAMGQLDTVVPHADFQNEVGSMARAVAVLQQGARAAEALRWVKASAAKIIGSVQAIDNMMDFSNVLMAQLTELTESQVGLIYVLDSKSGTYCLQGTCGATDLPALAPAAFVPGDGLVGQCARDGKALRIERPVDPSLRIRSGLFDSAPSLVRILPVCNAGGVVLAVIELGSFSESLARHDALIDEVLPLLALSLEVLERNRLTHELRLDDARAG